MKQFNWSVVSKQRNTVFGISILSIMFFHYLEDVVNSGSGTLLYRLARNYNNLFGSIGVEIFLFLSGMGLYFSMTKDNNLVSFYSKRLKRILVPYLIWGAFFWAVKDFYVEKVGTKTFLKDYSLISFWTDNNRNLWFIAFILLAYLVFPIIFAFCNNGKLLKIIFFMTVILAVTYGLPVLKTSNPAIYEPCEIALKRFPIFIAGVFFGENIKEGAPFSSANMEFIIGGLIFKLVDFYGWRHDCSWRHGIYARSINAWFAVFLVVALSILASYLSDGLVRKFLVLCGNVSLELYMTHVCVRKIMNLTGYKTRILVNYLICIAISVVLTIILHFISNQILKLLNSKNKGVSNAEK